MQPFHLEAKVFFENFESQTKLSGKVLNETTKQYYVKPFDIFKVGFGRTKVAYSLFGISYEYYFYLQGEIFGGDSFTEYWRAASNTVEFKYTQKLFSKGEPYFFSSPQTEIAEKKFGFKKNILRDKLNKNFEVKNLIKEIDPSFLAVLVYSSPIPEYAFSLGSVVLDFPYETHYHGGEFRYVLRVEKKGESFTLKNAKKFVLLLAKIGDMIEIEN